MSELAYKKRHSQGILQMKKIDDFLTLQRGLAAVAAGKIEDHRIEYESSTKPHEGCAGEGMFFLSGHGFSLTGF